MYLKMGTPEDARKRNRQWHSRLMDIEDSIRDYQKQAGMHSPGSPESQVGLKRKLLPHSRYMSVFVNIYIPLNL